MKLSALQAVAANLSDYQPALFPAVNASEREYLQFYQLDLADQYPGLRYQLAAIPSGAYRLCLHVWQPAAADNTLLLVHGYLDHAGLYGHLVRYGLDNVFNVVAFDLPGHGLSSGEQVVIDNFSDYSQAISDVVKACSHLPGDWRVMAQSMGGAALFDYLLTRGPAPFQSAVLLAPLIRPRGWWWIKPTQRVLGKFLQHVGRGFADNSNDAEFLGFVRNDPLQSGQLSLRWIGALRRWLDALPVAGTVPLPMLVIQGDADKTVDWRYNVKRIEQLFAGVEVRILAGGRHHLANESADLRAQIFQLADAQLMRKAAS